MLPALSLEGIIYMHVIEDSVDGNLFCNFVRQLVQQMNPYPGPQSVLILDNCAIHHVEEVEDIAQEA